MQHPSQLHHDPSAHALGGGAPPMHPGQGGQDDGGKEKAKRGYRACLHCRSRKAKCDLGDIDAPSSPPCSRCRRESRECVFAPSRRGGNNAKRRRDDQSQQPSESAFSGHAASLYGPGASMPRPSSHGRSQSGSRPAPTSYPTHVDVLNPSPKADYLFNHPSASSAGASDSAADPSPVATQTYLSGPATGGSGSAAGERHDRPTGGSSDRGAPTKTPDTKRRRLHLPQPTHTTDASSIVVADMQNESDALNILALASGNRPNSDGSKSPNGNQGKGARANSRALPSRRSEKPATIDEFALVRLGIVDEEQVSTLVAAFFRYYHHIFPMVPAALIPNSPETLADLARSERYLVTAMVIIASRHDKAPGMGLVHERAWEVMRTWISDITCLGAPPTVGLVEALLLLAEWLPRDPPRSSGPDPGHAQGFGDEVHGAENRQAWALIGMAIRCAYGLGLDKLALKVIGEVDRTYDTERGRLVWTYCYLFDRHVSLRLGKAFWSRGPNLCFQGFSASAQTGPACAPNNYPFLREIKPSTSPSPDHPALEQEDYASLVQTYLELTQLMSNAHDVLYPNAARTRSLVVYGEYFKYIDELARSLDGFKILWRDKKWKTFPLTDAMWAMFYYTQLYICAFSFQAHVERSAMRAEEEYRELSTDAPRPPLSLFPRGAAASPDARYIFQSIDAARQLLHICVDSFYPGGALPYLPNRFLLWFTYAAIVLLKALYSGAMLRADHPAVHKLIDRLCECLESASDDDDHPAVRYGRQLQALRAKLAGMATSANSPTGGDTVPLPGSDEHQDYTAPAGLAPTPGRPHRASISHPGAAPMDNQPVPWLDASVDPWSFPPPPLTQNAPFSFTYSTPGGSAAPAQPQAGGSGTPGLYVAPPHQQPLSDLGNLHPREGVDVSVGNNLGFATLDDWFVPNSNMNGNSAGVGGGAEEMVGAGNPLAGLDFSDFWMKVGPGEAQGGFPFR